jgi:hypothetical protein
MSDGLELSRDCPQVIAAWAIAYLLDQPADCYIRHDGPNITWYIGWGGRTVVRHGGKYQLKSFRRFEHMRLKNLGGAVIDVSATFQEFKDRASLLKGAKE